MADDSPPEQLVGRSADERLLDAGPETLPASMSRPVPLPDRQGRSPLVAAGVALGGFTLLGGIALAILGVVELLSGSAVTGVVELWVGIILAATHWGWIHLGAWTSDKLVARDNHDLLVDRQHWLEAIEPYARYEVTTHVENDGSITIETVCHRPALTDSGSYTFTPERTAVEVHAADQPAAAISERAELLRREAAARTTEARQRYQAAAEAREMARLKGLDEQEQLAAARAASQALSEQLNSKLRDPPLVE
jgi:hypothetical protein